jgi:DNA-binding Lrp family transcriptional regulator
MYNCRISCRELAEKYNSSRGVVRKRIKKLVNLGVIEHFTVWYSPAMIDANDVFGHIRLGMNVEREKIHRALEENPMIHGVAPVTNGDIIILAVTIGVDGLADLGSSIRRLEGVEEAELHLIQSDRGKKVDMKKTHLRVLSALVQNSRLSGAEIARRTGMSPRRVRKILNEIMSGGGIVFGIARNPAHGTSLNIYLKTRWDEKKTSYQSIIEKMQQQFPEATWESYPSASDPVLFTRFVVEHIKDLETISNSVAAFDGVKTVETLVFYPARISSILTRERLIEDVIRAGFEIC